MKGPAIFIATTTFGEYDMTPIKRLEEKGFVIQTNPFNRKLTPDEVVKLALNVIGIIAGTESYDRVILERLFLLKVLSRCGVGLDNVDLDAAKKLGIKVFNTPDAPTLAVAELTISLIFNLLRNVSVMDRELRNGKWQKRMGSLLSGKRVGIIGFGRIGKKIAELLKPFCCRIAYTDPFVEDCTSGARRLSLEELLTWADIVSLHVSVNDKILGEKEISIMRKGGWLVNVSRGSIVDENVLYTALKSGHLSGAALDVFEQEPYSGLLKELDNVILTPHIGSYAKEARMEMEMEAVKNLLEGLKD